MNTTCAQSHSIGNNEYSYSAITTRKVLFDITRCCRHYLRFSTYCGIIFLIQRRETPSSDLYVRNRRILHTRRNSSYPPDYRRLCDQTSQTQANAWIQGRRILEDKQDRVQRVSSSAKKHQTRHQIKKATVWWQWTTAKFLVFRAYRRRPEKLMRDGPRYLIPIFSIANETKSCQWLHETGM